MLDEDDHKLSMRISPKPKAPQQGFLRTLLLHRLSDTKKLVIRRSLKTEEMRGWYCENCGCWYGKPLWNFVQDRIVCGGSGWRIGDKGCGRIYRVEAVFYEEVLPEEDYFADEAPEEQEDVQPGRGAEDQEPAHVAG